MKSSLFILFFGIATCSLTAQTNIYVSNNGINTGTSLPTINNPAGTLENAYYYIKNNLSNSNNQAITPINVYLMNNGGDVKISNGTNQLVWDISGTSSCQITLTSYGNSSRSTLTRNGDSGHMLYIEKANYLKIKNIDFNKVASGAILIDNGDNNEISFCSFHGDGNGVAAVKSGVIWIGINQNYIGQNSETSSDNTIKHNLFYNIKVNSDNSFASYHHAIYVSQGAHNNTITFNNINYAPGIGIFANHGDYKNNYISANMITKTNGNYTNFTTGLYLSLELNSKPNVDNGAPNSITGNLCANNYVNDLEHNFGVSINDALLQFNNTKSSNKHYTNLYPSDPYWLGYTADKITDRIVTGDFDEDGSVDDVAAFYDLGGQTKIHVWQSKNGHKAFEYSSSNGWWHGTSLTPSTITKRVVVGDFDHDGYKDDIAAIHKGTTGTGILAWISDGSKFPAAEVWWGYRTWYHADKVTGRVVSGDFDEDGWEDDIATFYDYGNNLTRIHVWRSNGVDGFDYMGSTTQWTGSNYSASAITDRLVSGDFDNDGYSDDIAAFYDNGNNSTLLNVWTFDKIDFFEKETWWNVSGYNANMITGRVVSGDFDGNGIDDIATFYDYANSNARIHTWLSSGTHITYQGSNGWWKENTNGYNVQNITGRVVSGDFNNDGKYDISAFYDYSGALGSIRSNVWHSSGTSSFTRINHSLGYPWLTDFSYFPDGTANLMARMEPNTHKEEQELIRVYPNPTSEQVQFEFKDIPLSIKVFDLSGRLVIDRIMFDKSYILDVSDQSSGIYFYKVNFTDQTLEGRLIIE
ncbi:T9SS type A sorting domain-containing protein [Ulvibacterium marinum]|uniref:T9SS C-terminal target domain-containing protein n=1 Tax=Ulvibacterium marinum TaxID=2419782 RepID=A0A3B0C9W1_9FLAO|nr:T9SS type A sorting domain-containing protein [Ulvibacterium marinum]RKN81324.1 T9SS C-terminal target domain-containing protein [Ulvibacterium marinum]